MDTVAAPSSKHRNLDVLPLPLAADGNMDAAGIERVAREKYSQAGRGM